VAPNGHKANVAFDSGGSFFMTGPGDRGVVLFAVLICSLEYGFCKFTQFSVLITGGLKDDSTYVHFHAKKKLIHTLHAVSGYILSSIVTSH